MRYEFWDSSALVACPFPRRLLSGRSVPKMLGEWLITMMDYLACFGVGNLFKISVIFAVDYPFLLEPFPRFSMEFVAGQLLGANVAFAGE